LLVLAGALAGCTFRHGTDIGQSSGDARLGDGNSTPSPPAFDASASQSGLNVSSLSWMHTASGNNRFVVIGVSWGLSSTTITSITYAGEAMTLLGMESNATNGGVNVAMYMLVAPPLGAQPISVTFSGGVGKSAIGGSVSFTGVDQTVPVGAFGSAMGNGASISVSVASGPSEIVMDTVSVDSNPTSLPAGAGQTALWHLNPDMWGAAGTHAGATAVTVSWTESGGTDPWAQSAVSIRGG
jgi:hypothetical protein